MPRDVLLELLPHPEVAGEEAAVLPNEALHAARVHPGMAADGHGAPRPGTPSRVTKAQPLTFSAQKMQAAPPATFCSFTSNVQLGCRYSFCQPPALNPSFSPLLRLNAPGEW